MPPQALELEEAVLGALLLERDAFFAVSDILSSAVFYKEAHQKVYGLIESLVSKNEPVDMLTVSDEAEKKGILEEIGGRYFITQLLTHVASAAHIEYHARIIQQKYVARETIRLSSELLEMSYDSGNDVEDLIFTSLANADKLAHLGDTGNTILTNAENLNDAIERAKDRNEKFKNGELIGLPPKTRTEREFITSYKPGDVIVIAARPGMGKTAFVLSLSRYFASLGLPGVIFSLEMTKKQLTDRNICAVSGINNYRYKTGNIYENEWEKLDSAVSMLWDYPIYIDDTSNASLAHIRKVAKIYKMKGQLQWLMIDYLQLMNTRSDNRNYSRENEVAEVSKQLKALAKDLEVPIFELSQLNRASQSRGGRRPELSDLRESGAIEQDADVVILLHRPEYYDKTDPEVKNVIEVIFAKNRDGKTGTADLKTTDTVSEFYDLDEPAEDYKPLPEQQEMF